MWYRTPLIRSVDVIKLKENQTNIKRLFLIVYIHNLTTYFLVFRQLDTAVGHTIEKAMINIHDIEEPWLFCSMTSKIDTNGSKRQCMITLAPVIWTLASLNKSDCSFKYFVFTWEPS